MRPFDELSEAGRVRRYRPLALCALPAYGLEGARLVPVREGEAMVWRVDADGRGRFALRIHGPSYVDEVAIRSEAAWLRALRAAGLPVPEPVATLDGGDVVVVAGRGIDGPRVSDLLGWQDGRFSHDGLTPRALTGVGRLLARIHSAPFTPPPWFRRQRWDGEHIFGRPMEEALRAVAPHISRDQMRLVERVVARDRAARAALGSDANAVGMIHADLTFGNLLFHRGETRAIDFGDCGYGHFLYDIAVALSRAPRGGSSQDGVASLLGGYREIRPLPVEHEAHLPSLMAARVLSLMAWNVIRWSDPDVSGYMTSLERSLGMTAG